jgi:hypothetical protein
MKIALCFIISYDHILNKEHIWKKWIDYNKDIINIYFFYKDKNKIKSEWILKHTIPEEYIVSTSYFHVVPAYLSILNYAMKDLSNEWFCMLTDSCCPIISPQKLRYLFMNFYSKSIFNWNYAWWNIHLVKRGNLSKLPKEYHLGNDPYFVLCREHVDKIIQFSTINFKTTKLICDGGVANESLFAICLKKYDELENVLRNTSHIADWERMMSPTSPYLFDKESELDKLFIEENLKKNNYVIFIRKVSVTFSDDLLNYYIYNFSKDKDKYLFLYTIFSINNILLTLFFVYSFYCLYLFLI